MTASGNPANGQARDRARRHWQVAPSVWPTLIGAGASFGLAAYERLVWPQILGCVLVALVATSLFAVAVPIRFAVGVEAPAQVRVGEPFDTTVRLHNRAGLRRSVVVRQRWRSRRALVAEMVAFVDVVDGHGDAVVTSSRTPIARGVAEVSDVEVEIAGPFGFFSRIMRYSTPSYLTSVPAAAQAVGFLAGSGYQSGSALGSAVDEDLRGVRDWRPGDQISQVHWRSVARTGRMTVVERDGRSAGTLVVVVAAPGKRGRPVKDPAFESALAAAAATSIAALRQGVATCLVAQTPQVGMSAGVLHPSDEDALLDCFARIDVARVPDDALLEHALSHAAHGGTLLIVAGRTTPLAWSTRLHRAAAAVGAIAVDVGGRSERASA